jgi:hypothetical protein
MKKIVAFTITAILLSITLLLITCQKEYSYEGGPINGGSSGTAVYSFVGTAGNCSGATVAGKYYAGKLLDAGNTVQLQVDVSTAGTYQLNTTSSNGFRFSASGSFTTTGVQMIVLTASGTPAITGPYTFYTSLTTGCAFLVLVEQAPVAIAAFSFSGAPGACSNAKLHGDYFIGTSLTNANTVDITVDVTAVGAYTIKTDTINGISFSASGSFTNMGIQTVTLVGKGTPDLARNLTFVPRSTAVIGCNFYVTVLPISSGPMATYVLESSFGSPSPCIYTVSGNYSAGTQLTAANSITIKVFVTVAGNFAVSSNETNGMLFTYTGIFTATGSQFLTLQAIGKPITQGQYTFTPEIVGPHPLGGQACDVGITVN